MAYDEIEPFGDHRADYNAAKVVAMVHNTAVKEEDQKAVEHFLLKFEKKGKRRKQSVEEQVALATSIVATNNALAGKKVKDI